MKWIIYYAVTIILNIIAAFIFHEHINITVMSILPLLLLGLMIFQGFFFRNYKIEDGFRTAYGSDLNENEENTLFIYNSNSIFTAIPFVIPFVIFFVSGIKFISILVYILALTSGPIIYRLKHKGTISNRINAQNDELKRQKEKEELGKWK